MRCRAIPGLHQSRPRFNRDKRNGNSISDAGRLRRVVNAAAGIARPFTPVPDRAHFDPARDRGRPRRSSAFHGVHRCPSRRGPAGCPRPGATRRHDPTCRGRDVHGLVHAAREDGNRGHPNSHDRPGLGPPSRGTRISPSSFPALARINAAAGGSVFTTDPGAHNYRFLGLEIAPTAGAFLYNVVTLGAAETSVDQQPHNMQFERRYIHGDAVAGSRRGIAMNGVNIGVYDSIFTDFKEVGADSQALAGWNGAGPFTIVNNELEGAGENLIFGGADPQVPGLVPADIVVRHNHFFKPLSWKVDDPGYAGTHWSVTNLFEL